MIVKYNSNTFGKWYQQNSRASRGWPRSETSSINIHTIIWYY